MVAARPAVPTLAFALALALLPGTGRAAIRVPAGEPCGAVAVPAEPSNFGYGPTVGAQVVWARRVSCAAAMRLVGRLVAGRPAPSPWRCSYQPYYPASCRAPGGRRVETLTVSDGR